MGVEADVVAGNMRSGRAELEELEVVCLNRPEG
jgi:hypothetical protein